MRNEVKKYFFGFAKSSENEANQDTFCFISLRSKNKKKEQKREPSQSHRKKINKPFCLQRCPVVLSVLLLSTVAKVPM
jgi:hypothetical protein